MCVSECGGRGFDEGLVWLKFVERLNSDLRVEWTKGMKAHVTVIV